MKKYFLAVLLFSLMLSLACAPKASAHPSSSMQASAWNASVADDFSVGIDHFRAETYQNIVAEKDATQNEIASFDKISQPTNSKANSSKPLDGIKKPVAYIKFFLLATAALIFGIPLIFYGISAFIVFFIARFIYRKIRQR